MAYGDLTTTLRRLKPHAYLNEIILCFDVTQQRTECPILYLLFLCGNAFQISSFGVEGEC